MCFYMCLCLCVNYCLVHKDSELIIAYTVALFRSLLDQLLLNTSFSSNEMF